MLLTLLSKIDDAVLDSVGDVILEPVSDGFGNGGGGGVSSVFNTGIWIDNSVWNDEHIWKDEI